MLKTSIAMTTYNGAQFVQQQLDSFESQTRLPDELIICDDGSTDQSVSIIEAFAKKASFPVKLVVNPVNLGYIKNFQKAISLCSGDLVFLSDHDDVWRNDKLEIFSKTAIPLANQPALIFSNAQLINGTGKATNQTLWKLLRITGSNKDLQKLRFANYVTGATCAINRKLIDLTERHSIPAHVPHDHTFTLLAWSVGKIEAIDEKLVFYRVHENNQIGINRNFIDRFRARYKSSISERVMVERRNCREIAIYLQNFDRDKAKIFWRKSAYYRLMSRASPLKFIKVGYKYHPAVYFKRISLIRIIKYIYLRRLLRILMIIR